MHVDEVIFHMFSLLSHACMPLRQYRMHPDICSFPSDYFYGGKLVASKFILQRPVSIFLHSKADMIN